MNFLMNLAINTTRILAKSDVTNETFDTDTGGGTGGGVHATQGSDIAAQVTNILKTWIGPLFIAIGGIGAVYIIILAVQYAKSENDSKRAEVKTRIVNCAIGVVSLLVIATLCMVIDWYELASIFGYASN